MTALLEISGLTAGYGETPVLFGVDLAVDEGETVGLLGRNGMGKTTSIMTVIGLLKASGGEIRLAGRAITNLPPHHIAQMGIGLVPEGRRCFGPLNVRENLEAVARPGNWNWQAIAELFPRLAERRRQRADTLSGGEQQMLAIARALVTNPRLLILDEATEGLAPRIRDEIWRVIGELKQTGLSILVVDKSLSEMRTNADRCVILERGRTCWQGKASDLTDAEASRWLGV